MKSWTVRLLALMGLLGAVWGVAQSQSNSAIGSYLALQGQVIAPSGSPTLYSTNDVQGGDTVRWTSYFNSRLDYPFEAEGVLALPRNQVWVRGSLLAPPNTTLSWKLGNAWTDSEPSQGTEVAAVRWKLAPLYTAKLEASEGGIDFSGTGDGVRVIPYKDKYFAVNHNREVNYFHCRSAKTGGACAGFPASGVDFSAGYGSPLSGGSSRYRTPDNPLEAVNHKTGEMFVVVFDKAINQSVVMCTNLDSFTSCGQWNQGGSGTAQGLEQVGDEYYFYYDNDLRCFNVSARSSCGSWALGYARSMYVVHLADKLFFNASGTTQCFDLSGKRTCDGWGGGVYQGDGIQPLLDGAGNPQGICGTSGMDCRGMTGGQVAIPGRYMMFLQKYGAQSRSAAAVSGTRVFAPRNSEIGCYDFATQSECGSRASAETWPYTIRKDPTRPNCILALGHTAQATIFDPNTLGQCKGSLNGTLADIAVQPTIFHACDPARAQVRSWGAVRMSPSVPWGGNDGFTSVTLTIKDAQGQVLPASYNPVRQFAWGRYQISIADIPYALYPEIKIGLDFKTGGATPPANGFGIDVTWDGDPTQVCVSTQMPAAPDCQMTADLTVNTRTIDNTSGTWAETQTVAKTLSPGGLSSGYAAFSSATTSRLNLKDDGQADPKTQVVQGRWALQRFSGDLWSFQVGAGGQIDASSHGSAESATQSPTSRPVFTGANPNGAPSPVKALTWDNLLVYQQAALNKDLHGVADTRGAQRVDYLRGVDGPFRARSGGRLGPVINSAPVVLQVRAQAGFQEAQFPGYGAYRQKLYRPHPLAIWGGNDGALHGYSVTPSGLSEAWSFVPDVMLRRAAQFSDPDIMGIRANPYFVDNVPIVGHANAGRYGWRAIAVSTYGRGARAITALDVTETTLNAGKGVLFEYTNTTDPELKDLGYIISQPGTSPSAQSPQFVQIGASRQAAVLVGNGINSNDGTGGEAASGTGRAVLYAFYLDQSTGGKRWRRWAVDELWAGAKAEPGLSLNNGLSTPTAVDSNGDGIADTVYAGDIQGNLWRFDISDPDAPSVTRLFKTQASQPITQAPAVVVNTGQIGCGAKGASRCWQVVFATGAAISPLIGSPNVETQSIYSVLDKGKGATVLRGELQALPWQLNQIVNGVEYRALAPTQVDYTAKRGWVIDLQAYEHGVGAPRMQPAGLLMFSSIRPTTPDKAINVCIGPRSWLNEVDPINGVTKQVVFDTNGDGKTDSQDQLNASSSSPLAPQSMAVSGAQFGPPSILLPAESGSQQISLLLPSLGQDTGQVNSWSGGSSGGQNGASGTNSRALTHASNARLGRMSWREMY